MTNLDTSVIQVTNVSPTSSLEHMTTFFGYVGVISEIVIYPKEDNSSIQTQSKTCYTRFLDPAAVKIAQHLSNTVFIDRAIIVTPVFDDRIPDENTAFSLTSGLNTANNEGLINQVVTGNNGIQVISTIDPRLSALGLPQYPVLPSNKDPSRMEEIRRTVQVSNLDANVTGEDVLKFFNQIGEVKYVRLNSNDAIPANLTKLKVALVEFTEQSSVASALQSNGSIISALPIKVSHSTQAIIKPLASRKSNTQQKEIEDAMRRVRDSQMIEQSGIIKLENILHLTNEHNKNLNTTVAASTIERDREKRSTSRSRSSRSKDVTAPIPRRRYEDTKYLSGSSRDRDFSRRSRSRERHDDKYSRRSRDRISRERKERYSARRSRSPRRTSRSPRRSRRNSRSRERRRDDSRDRRRRDRSRSSGRIRRDRSRDRSKERYSSRRPKDTSPTIRRCDRHEKASRDEDSNLAMDQDLIEMKEARGPSTPPLDKLDSKYKRQIEERDRSESPSTRKRSERSKDDKHSKDRKKVKKDKRKAASPDVDNDDNNSISADQEAIEH